MAERYKVRDNFQLIQQYKSILVYGTENTEGEILISYVIPTNKRLETLKCAVQSIISIKHQIPYEIVVVDNSENLSPDSPVRAFFSELNDSHIKYYVNEKNIGMEGNWNRGAELARGTYVSYLHDDDLLDENYEIEILNCLHKTLQNKKNIGFIKPAFAMLYDENQKPPLKQLHQGKVRRSRKINSLAIGHGPTNTPTCGLLFNKTALLQAGGFDSRLYPSADHIMGFVIQQLGYSGYLCEDALGYYRIGINESMRFETILGFCKRDQIIREYMYRDNVFFSLFGMIFRKVQYSMSIEETYRYARTSLNGSFGIQNLDYLNEYRTYSFRKALIRIFRIGCSALSRIL